MTSHIQPEESWKKEFDRRFLYTENISPGGPAVGQVGSVEFKGVKNDYYGIKSFISQAIAEAVEAERKSLEVLYGGPWAVSADQACKELKEESARLKKMISEAILEERRKIVNRIEEEKSKGYEANTILEGLIAELKVGNLIHHQ